MCVCHSRVCLCTSPPHVRGFPQTQTITSLRAQLRAREEDLRALSRESEMRDEDSSGVVGLLCVHFTSFGSLHLRMIISYHMSYHVVSYRITSYHIISCHIMSCHVISYHIISYHIISCHIISCHIMSYRPYSYERSPMHLACHCTLLGLRVRSTEGEGTVCVFVCE